MKLLITTFALALCSICFTGTTAFAEGSMSASLAAQQGISEAEAKTRIQEVFQAIQSELTAGRNVQVRGFGTFKLSHREAREGRNPRTGEAIQIPARKYPRFTSSDVLKAAVNKS